jgi:hypothetical protein
MENIKAYVQEHKGFINELIELLNSVREVLIAYSHDVLKLPMP